MGLSRDSRHKRRNTGGRRNVHKKKRKFELARPAAMTRMGPKVVHSVRTRGGNMKYRALRADQGNFSWGTEACTRRVRILDVVYNATSNELLRTKTLVKNAIVQVDASLFKQWYQDHYGIALGNRAGDQTEEVKKSKKATKRVTRLQASRVLEDAVREQFKQGRLLAAVSSRPGQSGRVDGYILEGEELAFYQKKLAARKK